MQDVEICDAFKHFRAGNFFRIGVINSVHAGGFQNYVGFYFHRAQRGGRVRRKIRIACAGGENYYAAFFQMARGAAANKRLRHLMHSDRAENSRVAAHLFKGRLQRLRTELTS